MDRKWSKHQIYFINELNELSIKSLEARRDTNLKTDINKRIDHKDLDEELEVILYVLRKKRVQK